MPVFAFLILILVSVFTSIRAKAAVLPNNETSSGLRYPAHGATYTLQSGFYQLTYVDAPISIPSYRIPALNLKVAIDYFQEEIATKIAHKGADYQVTNAIDFRRDGVVVTGSLPIAVPLSSAPTLYDVKNLMGGLMEAYDLADCKDAARIDVKKKREPGSNLWIDLWRMILFYDLPLSSPGTENTTEAVWS